MTLIVSSCDALYTDDAYMIHECIKNGNQGKVGVVYFAGYPVAYVANTGISGQFVPIYAILSSIIKDYYLNEYHGQELTTYPEDKNGNSITDPDLSSSLIGYIVYFQGAVYVTTRDKSKTFVIKRYVMNEIDTVAYGSGADLFNYITRVELAYRQQVKDKNYTPTFRTGKTPEKKQLHGEIPDLMKFISDEESSVGPNIFKYPFSKLMSIEAALGDTDIQSLYKKCNENWTETVKTLISKIDYLQGEKV